MKAAGILSRMAAGLWLFSGILAAAAEAPAIGLAALIDNAAALDGTTVVFEGEAIGQALVRGEMAWINTAEGGGAIGVWTTAAAAAAIAEYGSYATRGARLRVVGGFHRACPEHGGELDIHASTIAVIEAGGAVGHPVESGRIAAAAVLALTSGLSLAFALKGRGQKSLPPARRPRR